MAEVRSIFGWIDQFTAPELATTLFGVGVGMGVHFIGESIADGYFKDKYPENYPVYSTLAVAGVVGAASAILWFLTKDKPEYTFAQYIIAGLIIVEFVQLIDLIRVQFILKG